MDIIKKNKLFNNISVDKLEFLNSYNITIRNYPKNSILIEENTISNELYLIIEGSVSIQKMASNGEYFEIAKRSENEYVGEMGLIDGSLRSARVICKQDCKIAIIPKDIFFSIIDILPEIENSISKEISTNLRQLHEKTLNEYEKNIKLLELNKKISTQNKELENLNILKNNLIQMITHDLKMPLTIISGYATLLSERLTTKPESEIIKSIEIAIKQMFDMIEMLLEVTKIENKEMILFIKKHNILPLINNIIEQFELLSRSKNQKIELKVNTNNKYALIDPDKFKRIIGNLLSNAIKYSPHYSIIEILIEDQIVKDKKYIKVSIIDNGPGIDEDEQKKLFRKFEKLSSKPTGNEVSTGLGLFIVKQLVELHNGLYGVKSTKNEGSCFYVSFPSEN